MAYMSGQHGRLYTKKLGDSGDLQEIGRLTNWSMTLQQSVLDTTTLQDTDRTIINGVRSYSGQATMFYYNEASSSDTSNVGYLTQNFIATGGQGVTNVDFGRNAEPEFVLLKLRLAGDVNRDIDVVGQISSFSITCSTGEVVTAEIGFEGTGAPSGFNL